MKQRLRRPLAMLLTVVMLLGLLPTAAFAVEDAPEGTATAATPEAITLEDAACEVGGEVALNGTATVLDGGTLSYQWYQSSDDTVDDADATEDEKNDTLLENQTDATLTVNTTEAGTFYYYVVATNTVTLADGTTTTASTTSNVATVTVTAGEPVPPSGSNEPEDGQEPSADGTLENEQTPGNDDDNGNANGEPGDNEPNGDPNGGEPGPGPADPEDGKASDAKITSLTLKGFTPFGEIGSSDLDLLTQEYPVQWDLFSPYTLEVGVSVPAGSNDNKVTITLPEGMKFVGLEPNQFTGIGVDSAAWDKGSAIYGYQPDNGTLTVSLASSASSATISVSVQPDGAFFPPEKHDEGISIKDAIRVQVNDGAGEESIAAVDVAVKTSLDIRVPYIGDGDVNGNVNTAAGGTVTLEGNVYTGWLSTSGANLKRLVTQLSFALEVPEGFTVANASDAAQQWQITQGGTADGKTTWMFSATEGLYGTSRLGRISITVPERAEEKAYPITLKGVSAQTYGQDEAMTGTYNTTLWTVTVKDPQDVEVQVKVENFPSVLNYTAIGNKEGTFDDYNSLLTAAVITNEGLQAVNQSLIYEAEFDQVSQFITAVGIPCGWGKEGYMPTSITVTYQGGTSTTLTENEIETVAALATDGYGFVLRGEDIPGYPGKSIAKIKVELPGLPQNYKSSVSPYFSEGNNAYNACRAYAGAWGRVREEVQDNTVATNQYSIYLEDEDAPTFTQVKTTYKNQAQISDEPMTATLTVGGTAAATVNSGGLLHVKTPIRPSIYRNRYNSYESSLLDPVIYLLEPEDLSIENVKITTDAGAELTYHRTDITGLHQNLNGYKLYEYTLADRLMLGWWDGDWNGTTLNLEFDYRVDTAAQTRSYDLRDLILFKSSLNLAFARYGEDDIYGLNDGNDLGAVRSNTFTVQAATDFNIATAIQIEGENKWYSYDPENPASTTSVFTEGATANVRVTVTNNSGETANNTVVYIPVPKKGQANILGEHFISEAGFDMFIADKADLTGASGWDVQYGQVTGVTLGDNSVPTGEFELNGNWSDEYDENTNMIKLTLSSGMANGASAEIILKFKATEDTGQTDSMNIFKSWYKYATEKAAIVDTEKVYNFGTLLQNGQLDGTVYLDANRNGVKDEGETGFEGVTVKVTDSDGRTYETQTGEDGAYSFNSLPGKKELTLTVTNPSSPDPNNSGGSYRFYGGDVTPAEDNRTASKSKFTLTDGTATVNAGLIEPYTVTFLVAGGDGTTSFVNPSTRKIYAGQTLGEVTELVTVSLAPGLKFENKWNKMSTAGGESTVVQHSKLLEQTVTADTTFTAITSSVSNTVTAMWWDTETGSITQQFELTVDWNKPVGSYFPEDSIVNNRPGYNFTGWSVNGTNVIVRRDKIINASVTGAVNYIAQYTEKTDITVTLNANGGAFADGKDTVEMPNQKYGAGVDYDTPTREGYTFLGWSTDKDATEGSMSLTCQATDTTFFAVWEPGTVRLTLLGNGGTWTSSTYKDGYIDGTVGEAVNLPGGSEITREGYEFQGWYVQGDLEQKVLSNYAFPTKATILIAKWEPKQESITFDYGEESGIKAETVSGPHGTYVGDEQANKLIDVTREGWSLTGWKNEATGVVTPAANTGSIVIEDEQKYIAQWAQGQSMLKFNAGEDAKFPNNGQVKTYYGNTGSDLEHGEPVNPEREGYKFLGWFDDPTGGDAVTEFTFPQTENGEKTYYAQWGKETYTVTFRYNGGTLEDAAYKEVPVEYLGKVTDVPVPTNGNAELLSWTDVSTGETYSAEQIEKREVKANTIYSANWNLPSYQVTFGNLGGNPDSTSTVSVTSGNGVFAPDPQTPDGKVFLHWLLTSDTDATKTEYSDQDLAQLKISENMTFQAVFGEDSYTITFITSNGSFEGGGMEVTITKKGGEKLAETDFPEVTSDTELVGWYYGGQTKPAAEWADTVVECNMTFVAAFEGKVTVSFNTMGGKWTDDGQQYANGIEGNAGDTMKLPTAEHITRTGYTFMGWYTDMACTTKAPDVFPGSRTTYYAGWSTEGLSVTVTETPTYDGTPKTPALTVKVGDTELTAGEDYVAIYENYINAGTATVKVYGIEDYAGLTGTATFTIQKAEQIVNFVKSGVQTAIYGENFANTATAKLDSPNVTISYSSSDDNIATVDANGTVTILKSGTVTITATAEATDNVNKGEDTYTLTIGKANPTLTFANSTVSVKTTGSVSNELTTEPSGLTVTYTSSDPKVATVDATTGKVTLVGKGTTTITATFKGDEKYNGAEATYTLTVDNDAIAYTAEGWHGAYDTQEHGITVNVTTLNSDATVTYSTTEDSNFTAQNPTFTNAGTYTVYFKIEAKGYDAVTGSAKVIIEKAQLTEATVTGGEYTGQPVEGTVSEVKAGTLIVPAGSYEVSYVNNVNAGTAVAIITAKADSNFIGTVPETFTIDPKNLTEDMVSPIADQPYTGEQIKPDVTVADGSTTLVEGKDFTVSYGDNNTVGPNAGTVTIKGTGNYAGTVPKQFNITNSGTFEVIVDNYTLTYDGTEKKPAVTVWAVSNDGSTKTLLTVGTDYDVTYADNINAGTASVTVKGMGDYTESGKSWKDTTVYFTIQPAEQSVTFAGVTDGKLEKTYGDSAFTQAATVALRPDVSGQTRGTVTYTSSNPAVATVDSTGKVTIVGAGTATITASAAATQNYKGAKASYTLTVKPKDINSEDVTASKIPDQPYGGIPVTPEFSLTDSDSDISKHDLEVNVDYTFTYSDNNGEGEGKITIKGTGNYTGTKEVTFKIISWSESQVVVTPAAITIYMGGANGYEGAVVDEETGSITASSSLPEPGFLFTLPDMLEDALTADNADLTDITFLEPASGKEWTAELYAEGASSVYRLVPGEHQEPVRVQFTNAQGQTVTEDRFEVGENINQTLTMTLYKGDVGVIYAIYDGVQYPIRLGKSTLTVRGVTEEAQYAAVTDGTEAPAEGKPAVAAESGTSYTINDSDVPVEDTSGVALLFDSIIDAGSEDRTSLLEDKAEDTMETLNKEPASGNRFAYSFQYLDLVDTNNGNAWVKASKDVTIYWPYPAGTNMDTEFTLLHFEGLHREMDTSEIGDQIANCTVREVTIANKTDTHIVLKVGSAGFSPFALVWEEKIPTYTITATSNGNGSITPAGVTTVQEGGSQSYTIKADNGYHISDVKVNGVSVGAVESYPFTNVQSNQTIAVTFSRNNSGGGGGGGGGTTRYIIEAEAGWGGDISPDGRVSVSSGSDKTFRITADEGYEIADVIVDGKSVGAVSSYTFENVRKNHTISVTFQEAEQVADPDDTGVSGWLNTKDHIQYLSGYGGGKFGPTDNMTRAQAAQMFYNLLLNKNVPITVSFTDVAADAWYAKAVNTLASLGIVNGVGNSQFAPERAITRAEFTVIAMRFAHLDTTGENIFSDVTADAWYYDYVVGSIQYGWINGYEDGTFRPNNTITRSEVTAIVNRMLGRSADKAFVDRHADELTQFSDVPGSYWAYYEIMEAANAHDYVKDNGVEDWTRLQ